MDLRETFTNVYEDFLKAFFHVETIGEKKEKVESNINIGFFKINASVEKKLLEKHVAICFLERDAKILILCRSEMVGSYCGKWAGISGYVETNSDSKPLRS